MDVIVDGNANFALEGGPSNVLAAVAAVSKFLREQGRAIVSVKADGETVPYEDLARETGEQPLENVKVLEIQSEDVNTLVAEAIHELETALPDLPQACRELAAVFQSDRPFEGYTPFIRLADIWRHVKAREMQIASALNITLDSYEIEGKSIDAMHVELNKFLEEAAEAVERQDAVLLADLLEYELAPRAEQESAIAAVLKEQAARPSA